MKWKLGLLLVILMLYRGILGLCRDNCKENGSSYDLMLVTTLGMIITTLGTIVTIAVILMTDCVSRVWRSWCDIGVQAYTLQSGLSCEPEVGILSKKRSELCLKLAFALDPTP